jgi:hypothetical protein
MLSSRHALPAAEECARHLACQDREMDDADEIWNRAVAGGGVAPGLGDRALFDVLRLHSLAMNSGLLDAIERLSDVELVAADAGYRWLGLAAAADVVASVRDQIASGALDDDDRAEALEQSADDDYGEFIPTDSVIEAAFRVELERQPTAFAKL